VKPQQLDVMLEIPMAEANRLAARRGEIGPEIIDMSRQRAEELCREAGATLRTDRVPEFVFSEAQSPLLGDMLLVGSRWWAEVPEGFHPVVGP
jgi:hypothetical protein